MCLTLFLSITWQIDEPEVVANLEEIQSLCPAWRLRSSWRWGWGGWGGWWWEEEEESYLI